VPESQACAEIFVTPQEWNDQPAPDKFLIIHELWRRKVRGDPGPYLAFYGHIAWHDDAAESQAQNGALRLERLDDLHPLYLEGT
jgi:hypothetical protein